MSFELTSDRMDKEVNISWSSIQHDREVATDAYQMAIAAHKRIDKLIEKLEANENNSPNQ